MSGLSVFFPCAVGGAALSPFTSEPRGLMIGHLCTADGSLPYYWTGESMKPMGLDFSFVGTVVFCEESVGFRLISDC